MKEFKITKEKGHFRDFCSNFFNYDFSKRVQYRISARLPDFQTTIVFSPRIKGDTISQEDHQEILKLVH